MRALRWTVATLVVIVWTAFAVQAWRGEDVAEALFWAAAATVCLSAVDLGGRPRGEPDRS